MILLEWIFEVDFPDKEYVRGLVDDMNADTSCVYLKEMSRDSSSPDFIDGSKGHRVALLKKASPLSQQFIKCAVSKIRPREFITNRTSQLEAF